MEVLSAIVLGLHLACMNVATAGPLLCIWLRFRQNRGDQQAGIVGRKLAWASVHSFLAGMVLGGTLGLLMWFDGQWRFFSTLERIPSRVYFGIGELAFYLLCMAGYAAWWNRSQSAGQAARIGHLLLAILAASNLITHFPPLFVVISQVAVEGSGTGEEITSAEFRGLMVQSVVLARTAHFLLASIAVAGTMVMLLDMKPKSASENAQPSLAMIGARIALAATLLQVLVGTWVLLELDPGTQSRLMGGDLFGSLLLGVSLMAALGLLHKLSAVALGEVQRGAILGAAAMLLLVIVLMSGTLVRSRTGEFSRLADQASMPVETLPGHTIPALSNR